MSNLSGNSILNSGNTSKGGGGAGGAVNSVFGRTGNVVARNGDYLASQITFTPYSFITATQVQNAIQEVADAIGGGGSPGGPTNSLQINNGAGGFAGSSQLLFDGTTLTISNASATFVSPDGTKSGIISELDTGYFQFNSNGYSFLNTTNSDQLLQLAPSGDDTSLYIPYNLYVTAGGGNIHLNGNTYVDTLNVNNSIYLPSTTSGGNGVIYQDGVPLIHTYSPPAIYGQGPNFFAGIGAGNLTMTGGDFGPSGITGVGHNALASITGNGSSGNTAFGTGCAQSLINGGNNVFFGNYAGVSLTSANNCALFGFAVAQNATSLDQCLIFSIGDIGGKNYLGGESSNILLGNDGIVGESHAMHLGTTGTGSGQIQKSFIAGYTVTTDYAELRAASEEEVIGSTITIDPTTIGGFVRYNLDTTDTTIGFNLSNIPSSGYSTSFTVELYGKGYQANLAQVAGIANYVNNSFFSTILPTDNRIDFPTQFNVTIAPTTIPGEFRCAWTPLDQVTKPLYAIQTTDATATTIATIPVPTDKTIAFDITAAAKRTGGSSVVGAVGDSAGGAASVTVQNVGGTLTIANSSSAVSGTGSLVAAALSFSVSGTNLLIQVTGAIDVTASWQTIPIQKFEI